MYDVINVVEVIRTHFEQVDESCLEPFARIIVLDSLTVVLTGLLHGTDGVGMPPCLRSSHESVVPQRLDVTLP